MRRKPWRLVLVSVAFVGVIVGGLGWVHSTPCQRPDGSQNPLVCWVKH